MPEKGGEGGANWGQLSVAAITSVALDLLQQKTDDRSLLHYTLLSLALALHSPLVLCQAGTWTFISLKRTNRRRCRLASLILAFYCSVSKATIM